MKSALSQLVSTRLLPFQAPDSSNKRVPSPKSSRSGEGSSFSQSEAEVRYILKESNKYPFYINVIGGLTFLSISSENKFIFSRISLSTCFAFSQTFIQVIYFAYFLMHQDQMSVFMESYAGQASTEADRLVKISLFCLGAFAQFFIRAVYFLYRHRFAKFHEDLSRQSCSIVLDNADGNQFNLGKRWKMYLSHLKPFIDLKKYMKKTFSWIMFIICCVFSGVLLSLNGFYRNYYSRNVLPSSIRLPKLHLLFFGICYLDLFLISIAIRLQVLWFTLYIKWISAAFRALRVKSDNMVASEGREMPGNAATVEAAMANFVNLEKLVDDFNSLFEWPILSWLITTGTEIVMQLFFTLSWTLGGHYREGGIYLVPMALKCGCILFICNIGSDFACDVQKDVDQICSNLITKLDLEQKDVAHSPKKDFRTKIVMLHNRLHSNPIGITPGNFFTLNRKMMTALSGVITTYLIVLLQFRGAEDCSKYQCPSLTGNSSIYKMQ